MVEGMGGSCEADNHLFITLHNNVSLRFFYLEDFSYDEKCPESL
jgi:hypothetical protein